MREKDYYGAIKGFCTKWGLPPVWDSSRITNTNLIYEVIKVINAMIIELREYEDQVDGKLEDMLKMIEDFLKMFNEDLSDTVLTILLDWKESGELEEIINEALFNQKLDKSVFESFKETYDQTIININDQIEKIEEDIDEINNQINILHNDYIIYAKDYGFKQGIDNTEILQDILNSMVANQIVVLPAGEYELRTIKLPKELVSVEFKGSGIRSTHLKFRSEDCFLVESENNTFKDLRISGEEGITKSLFKDVRNNGYADFDLFIENMMLENSLNVVEVNGRGVVIKDSLLHKITGYVININFPENLIEGNEPVQKLETGMRGYIFKNNRTHYMPAYIIGNFGYNAKNVVGIQITNNQFEGSIGYVYGELHRSSISNNIQYQTGNIRRSLFDLTSCSFTNIDLNITGMTLEKDNYESSFNSLFRSSGSVNQVKIEGIFTNVVENLISLYGGGSGIEVNCVLSNCLGSLLDIRNEDINGLLVSGVISSLSNDYIAVKIQGAKVIYLNTVGLVIRGGYNKIHTNVGQNAKSTNNTTNKLYIGQTGDLTIDTDFQAQYVKIVDSEGSTHFKSILGSPGSPFITINEGSIKVTGVLNTPSKWFILEYE